MADIQDANSTSRIQHITNVQIARQAEICAANLSGVKEKITQINGDMGDIAKSLVSLREQVTQLTLDVTKQVASLKADVRSLKQRWSIWPTLKEILIVLVTLASLVFSVMAVIKSL